MIRNSNAVGNEVFYIIIKDKDDISFKIRFISWEDWDEIALLVDLAHGMFVDIDVFYPEDMPDSGGYLVLYGDYPLEDFPYSVLLVMKFIENNGEMVIVDIDKKRDRQVVEKYIKEHWKSG